MAEFTSNTNLPGPDDTIRVVLDNGVVILSRTNFNSPSVVISGYLPSGSLFDPDDKLGLADFTVSALMRGTQNRNFQQIFNSLESVGASLNISGATHSIGFNGRSLAEDLVTLVEILADALRYPIFPSDHVERLRAQLLTSLSIRAQDPGSMASLEFDKIVYDGHPYSRPEDGYVETISGISRDDLVSFHRAYYGSQGLVIAVVGSIDTDQAIEVVQRCFGDWSNTKQPQEPELPVLKPLNKTISKTVEIPGKYQSEIVLGAAGPSRNSEDFMPASLGNNILGQFGMMGRLGDAVREKAGLAYHISSSLSGGVGPGPWIITGGIDPANVEKAIDLTCKEIQRFISQPVFPEELEDSQAHFIGRLPLSLESNAGVAAALTNLERFQLGLDYYQRYPTIVRSVTTEDVLSTARRYLDPDHIAIVAAGPAVE